MLTKKMLDSINSSSLDFLKSIGTALRKFYEKDEKDVNCK